MHTKLMAYQHQLRTTYSQNLCPECGEKMQEVDRQKESSGVFIWYECTRFNCPGQWLHHLPAKS